MSNINLLPSDGRKRLLFITSLVVITVTALATLLFNNVFQKNTSKSEIDTAVNQAKFLYKQEKERGKNFDYGPCLSNALLPGWVVDLVHNPRLPMDDLPENQCSVFAEGKTQHFVELDLEGNLVRAK